MKKSYFPFLAVLLLTFSRFTCIEECEGPALPVHINEFSTVSLDNRNAEPVEISPGDAGFLNAYGFRFLMQSELNDPADSVDFQGGCAFLRFDPAISAFHIFTLTPIDNVPAGADVSEWFRYVDRLGKTPEYIPMAQAAGRIPGPQHLGDPQAFEFLLVTPPDMEGSYQFELRLTLADSSVVSVPVQPIYLQ